MSPLQQSKNPSSPSYSRPPSLDYLSELGLDYEWQNAWLESGSLFPFESHDSFLDTFIASGEISSTDKQAAKVEKKCIFPHINIPVSTRNTNIRPYLGPRHSTSPQKPTTSPTFQTVFSLNTAPLSPPPPPPLPPQPSPLSTKRPKTQLVFTGDTSEPQHRYLVLSDNLATEQSMLAESNKDGTLTSKKRKSIQAVCEDMKLILQLPADYSKLDTLNHVLELMEQGKLRLG